MEEEDVVERGVDDGDDDERVDKMAVMGGGRKEKRNEMSLPCEIISSSQLRSLSTVLLKIIMQIYSLHSHPPRPLSLSVSAVRSSLQSFFSGIKTTTKMEVLDKSKPFSCRTRSCLALFLTGYHFFAGSFLR